MTDPFFGPLVEALEGLLQPDSLGYNYVMDSDGDCRCSAKIRRGETNHQPHCMVGIAYTSLASYDPAPVLRVLRAAVELEKERKALILGGSTLSTSNFVQAESNHISAVKALLEVPAYQEWLEGVE